MADIARQWFVPGDGIDRHVISADIQRYLGNDATVRPGVGNGEHQGVQGYWIKAYRNLTSFMIADLKSDSARWRQEQQRTGSREYSGSSTNKASIAGHPIEHRERNSPATDDYYGLPQRERLPADRMSTDRVPADRMHLDQPSGLPSRGYPGDRPYPADGRAYGAVERGYVPDHRGYPQEAVGPVNYGPRGPPVAAAPMYADPRYGAGYPGGNGAPAGYSGQGEYMPPAAGPYEPVPPPGRSAAVYPPSGYGQPPPPLRGHREPGYPPVDYNDPRYSYPSPAATVTSVSREPAMPPAQHQSYGSAPPAPHDPYGGRRKYR